MDGVASMRLMAGDGIGLRAVWRRSVNLLRVQTRWKKKTGRRRGGRRFIFLMVRQFVICCVGDSFAWNINIHVLLSVSASGEPDVIDVRNGSCLGCVL